MNSFFWPKSLFFVRNRWFFDCPHFFPKIFVLTCQMILSTETDIWQSTFQSLLDRSSIRHVFVLSRRARDAIRKSICETLMFLSWIDMFLSCFEDAHDAIGKSINWWFLQHRCIGRHFFLVVMCFSKIFCPYFCSVQVAWQDNFRSPRGLESSMF